MFKRKNIRVQLQPINEINNYVLWLNAYFLEDFFQNKKKLAR